MSEYSICPGPTKIVAPHLSTLQSPALCQRIALRNKTAEKFIEDHGSGTLRKNMRIGMHWEDQYLHERIAYEFGWVFQSVHWERVTISNAVSKGDCKPLTEAGWQIERFLQRNVFLEDRYMVGYISIAGDGAHPSEEGIGLILLDTSAKFIPANHLVYGIIAPRAACSGEYEDAINPA